MDKLSGLDLRELAPSPLVKRFGEHIVESARRYPILDVACGGGRNGVFLSHLGGRVVGIDIDLSQIERHQRNIPFMTRPRPHFWTCWRRRFTARTEDIRDLLLAKAFSESGVLEDEPKGTFVGESGWEAEGEDAGWAW